MGPSNLRSKTEIRRRNNGVTPELLLSKHFTTISNPIFGRKKQPQLFKPDTPLPWIDRDCLHG